MIIMLHNKESKESRDFLEANKEHISQVLDWYGDKESVTQYALSGLEQPSSFPAIVYKQQLCFHPESVQWAKDEIDGKHLTEQQILDRMIVLSKLELMRALDALDLWKEVKPLIKGNETFEDAWGNAVEINTLDPVFLQGFAMTSIDMDTVKRKILENRNVKI